MTISDITMVLAVLLAPFLAVFAQKQIELWRERRSRKMWIFKTLMATRARSLSNEHVQALNMIDLEFIEPSDKDVITAWKEYHDQLNAFPKEGEDLEQRQVVWSDKLNDLLPKLLVKMGMALGYDFNSVDIRRGAYSPVAHANEELELQLLRKMMLEWLHGDRKVSVSLVPLDDAAGKEGKKFLDGIIGITEGQKKIKIEIVNDKEQQQAPTKS
ncbi:MAG TPA: hypothetical protein PLA03_12405 [Acidobacteriota bacterium]|nr:hypothetical protein [Acidobacteriota bacterium]